MLYVLGLILLWFRPEYRFGLFFAFLLPAIDFALFLVFGGMAWFAEASADRASQVLDAFILFIRAQLPTIVVFLGLALPIVALRKWMLSRSKSGAHQRADKLVAEARAEAAAREAGNG
jgi:hypothetical protein